MKSKIPLRGRIFAALGALVGITMTGAIVMIWYTYRMETLLSEVVEKHLAAFQTAEMLETALVNQKGFVTYFFQDGDPRWLQRLAEYRQIFLKQLTEARVKADNAKQRGILERVDSEYARYVTEKDQVIALYKAGDRDEGALLHRKVRGLFDHLLQLCEEYKAIHAGRIMEVRDQSRIQAGNLRLVAGAAMTASIGMAVVLAVILTAQIFGPVMRLFAAASRDGTCDPPSNVVDALSQRVHGLLQDVDQTQYELARSRESLLQAEKLAMVGKLAAGMAHSIRNPFTSVKMRLFSLNRSLELTLEQREDFDVISEEIRHVDTILQNFLEFSRPPKLKIQLVSPSTVVDMTLQLLQHRLKSYDVNVLVKRGDPLPEIQADPEQLKEVLANLMINACEAMGNGGQITITEALAKDEQGCPQAIVQVTDNGPGIPANQKDKVFQPFFTTKEDGTGLGLSIVERIVREHGGRIHLTSEEGVGTSFHIALPIPA